MNATPHRFGSVALLGRPNVGKSTLLNTLLGERIAITSPLPQTTRDRIAGVVTRDDVQFVFLDTPGIHRARHKLGERMNDLARDAAATSDLAIFMTDAAPPPGADDPKAKIRIHPGDREILETLPPTLPTILVVNKVDRVHPKSRLLPLLAAYGELHPFVAVVPISALKDAGTGVERILAEAGKLLPEGEALYDKDELSDKPVRFFVGEFVREQVLRQTWQEVPHGVAVTVESFDEGPKIVRIAVTLHVARESHKSIIIGDGGKMLGAIGTAARKRAEELVGKKVHLETWVRATPDWFDDPKRLEELGYGDDGKKRPKRAKPANKPQANKKKKAQGGRATKETS